MNLKVTFFYISDCDKNLCEHGWCEETITSYQCHCDTGFQGTYCNEIEKNRKKNEPFILNWLDPRSLHVKGT